MFGPNEIATPKCDSPVQVQGCMATKHLQQCGISKESLRVVLTMGPSSARWECRYCRHSKKGLNFSKHSGVRPSCSPYCLTNMTKELYLQRRTCFCATAAGHFTPIHKHPSQLREGFVTGGGKLILMRKWGHDVKQVDGETCQGKVGFCV